MLADRKDAIENNRDTALSSIARFRSDAATDDDRVAFALWLAQSPAHKQAMDDMLDMWEDLGSVRQLYAHANNDTSRKAANKGNWLLASMASAACIVLALVILPLGPQQPASLQFQTAIGEQKIIELEDSSTITLNTNSQLSVSFGAKHRSIELIKGEVFFEVAKDPMRPFQVNSGSATVTAIGTAFNIYRDEQTSSITVTEGVVRVTEAGNTGARIPASELLHANQQLSATPTGLQTATTINIGQSTAWRRGELVATDMPLPELIKQIERYHNTRILLADSNVAALRISGVFALNELDSILAALQVSLGLQIIPVDDTTFQLIKPPQ